MKRFNCPKDFTCLPCLFLNKLQEPVTDQDELYSFRSAYSVTHAYATKLVESDKFKFVKLKPTRVFYAGGFGVNAEWVSVTV